MADSLTELAASTDPFEQFSRWFAEAQALERDPTAMVLATATREGHPAARMVLLKGMDERGFVFYTNYRSRKGLEIEQTGRASLLFYWPSIGRQVRIEGVVEKVGASESDDYFATRHLESRWSAVASPQSEAIPSREWLESAAADVRTRYGTDVPRPPWWGGYRVVPDQFEFWQSRPHRLHDRLRYVKTRDGWNRERLAP
jgi:pyridoxamine 5'-phosphate oxidase